MTPTEALAAIALILRDYPKAARAVAHIYSELRECDAKRDIEEEMNRQILEAKCEGPSWGKEPIKY